MKKAKITTNSVPKAYENESQEDVGFKAAIIVEIYDQILCCTTVNAVLKWKDNSKYLYSKYFVILVTDILTVRDKKNIDKVILDIDLSEMEA